MRWKERKIEQERKLRRFLWWPKLLNDEWRWLERAEIRQVWRATNTWPGRYYYWDDLCWADDPDFLPEEEEPEVPKPPVGGTGSSRGHTER